jgi:hypothetical protein
VICTELNRQGLLDASVFEGDQRFGMTVQTFHPEVYAGYLVWAQHVVPVMKRSPIATAAVHWVAAPVVRYMAIRSGQNGYPSIRGFITFHITAGPCAARSVSRSPRSAAPAWRRRNQQQPERLTHGVPSERRFTDAPATADGWRSSAGGAAPAAQQAQAVASAFHNEVLNRLRSLAPPDKQTLIQGITPPVAMVLKKILPELADIIDKVAPGQNVGRKAHPPPPKWPAWKAKPRRLPPHVLRSRPRSRRHSAGSNSCPLLGIGSRPRC